jgi:hypothetical protein
MEDVCRYGRKKTYAGVGVKRTIKFVMLKLLGTQVNSEAIMIL